MLVPHCNAPRDSSIKSQTDETLVEGSIHRREYFQGFMSALGLHSPLPLKKKRPAPAIVSTRDWPQASLQIAATWFLLNAGTVRLEFPATCKSVC